MSKYASRDAVALTNADTLDGYHASAFVLVGAPFGDADTLDGLHKTDFVYLSDYSDADVLAKLLNVDGTGSLLDADMLDGAEGALYARLASPIFTGLVQMSKDAIYTDNYGNLLLRGLSDTNKRLAIGFDSTNDIGFLQAYINGVGEKSFSLNPNGGNVSIGRAVAYTKFHVYSTGGGLELATGATTTLEFIDRDDTNATVNVGLYARKGYFAFNTGSYTEVLRISNGGTVGIGTTTGLSKLSINGGLHVGGDSDAGDNNLLVDGTCEITGISLFTGYIKTVGGLHIGGTSDPGVDNLLIDGYIRSYVTPYASQTTGWNITQDGAGDFRYLYADELHAKAFIADLEQALAGGQIICKSVAPLAAAFTIPAAGANATLVVESFKGFDTFRVFVDGDIIRIRQFDRAGTSLSITNCWGTVAWVSTDTTNKTQTYTFTRSAAPNAGAATATEVIGAGTLALDYGTSGNGFLESNAIDGAMAVNSPYHQVVTFTGHPETGLSVRARLGNLEGLSGVGIVPVSPGYGLFSDNVYLQGKIVADSGYIGGITGWAITAGSLIAGANATRIELDTSVGIHLGATAFGDAPFSVTRAGALKATSGQIANWTISTSALYTGAFDTINTMYFGTSGISLSDTFKVTSTGALTAKGIAELGTSTAVVDAKASALAIIGPDIYESLYNGDSSAVHINRLGHLGTADHFRDFVIYNGKAQKVFQIGTSAGVANVAIGNDSDPITAAVTITGSLDISTTLNVTEDVDFSASPTIDFGSNHIVVTGTSDITCGAAEGDMTDMSTSFTPKGSKILITFSASFYVSSANQSLWLIINVGGSNVRTMRSYIIGGYQPHAISYISDVTPDEAVTVKMRWSGGNAIEQRGSTDGYRVMTITDLH